MFIMDSSIHESQKILFSSNSLCLRLPSPSCVQVKTRFLHQSSNRVAAQDDNSGISYIHEEYLDMGNATAEPCTNADMRTAGLMHFPTNIVQALCGMFRNQL